MLPTTLIQVVGLFNIFVGLMLTVSMLLMGAGILMWGVRLGTWPTYRTEAIGLMEWANSILFTLILLLLVSQFVQQHTAAAVFVLGLIIIGVIAWLAVKASQEATAHEEDH